MAAKPKKEQTVYIVENTDGDLMFYEDEEHLKYELIDKSDVEDFDGLRIWPVKLGKGKKLVGESWSIE